MEFIAGIIGLLLIVGFFRIVQLVNKMKYKQDMMYKLMAEQNALLSEQITIMKGNYNPDGEHLD